MAAEPHPEFGVQPAPASNALHFQALSGLQDWQNALAQPALLVLLGGAHCGVCMALQPRIAHLLQHTPSLAGLALASVDCEQAPAVCAQLGVFSVPVLRLYLDGRLALDFGRHFSLSVVRDGLVRQLQLHGALGGQGRADPDRSTLVGSAFALSGASNERNAEEQP